MDDVCAVCNKSVDASLVEALRRLPPMTGFNPPPEVVPCAICKKPGCWPSCVIGHGLFIFTCKGECTDEMNRRTTRPYVK
jgi:hypothetical protein